MIRYRAQITLKGHPRVSETFTTLREAQRWAERTTEAIRQRCFQPGSESEQHTVGDLVERYVEEKVPHLADRTQNRRKLYWWLDQLGKDTLLSQVTPASIALARDRLSRGQGMSGKKLSPATVRRYLTVLGGAMSTATKEWFWLEDNPCLKVKRPTEPRGRARFLDDDERQRLLAACKESGTRWLYPLVVTALFTGTRQTELLNLKCEDIDLDRGLAVIHHSKNGDRRALVITGLAEQVLKEQTRDREFVFGSGRGKPPVFPQRAWEMARVEAGIEDFRFHDLRHTFASYLAMSGATLARFAEAAECTQAPGGRTIQVGPYEKPLAEARQRQQDPDWAADYRATRPKVERKIDHLMRRRHGGRRARVRGRTKVAADFNLLAAAHNLARIAVLGIRWTMLGWVVETA